ncbi:formate dehydrogenase accessory sulfurtransferase FdhD [Leisingera methylohalidivorans]|uniref:Sulfur carrier protein FdhD n=1 Tax=Leisingera methylohalidivorans DSM 14336 TaxID=999552 RepID=V9VRR9_9RHOB|nr:formate dehydrogenase accessory sulfurtransferase FdhD [Leisingera methylohalidivorans]AHC99556.1 formate dehydrogenase accessory protein FdhD [Leisingera methylohalidivorans DSM 14336]
MTLFCPSQSLPGLSVRCDGQRPVLRSLPEELPVAMVFEGSTQGVMMATPQDIEDFAVGFALSEGYVRHLGEISEFETAEHGGGIEARFWLPPERAAALTARRRAMMGPVGCGLCGIDSLDQALRPLPVLASGGPVFAAAEVAQAADALRSHQPLHDQTHATHAAGFLLPGQGIVLAREDVGRHNALDKLIGALARAGMDPASGAMVLTSRVSVEMVQKTVMAGARSLIAVSAPTAHALRLAQGANLTLAAFARGGGFDLYSCPERIKNGEKHVA